MDNYKHCCVVDSNGRFVEFVLVENGKVLHCEMQYGDRLIDAEPPYVRPCAGARGFVSPVWDGDAWAESAADAEIAEWEREHPAPVYGPTQLDQIEAQMAYTAMMTDTLLEG